MAITAQDLIDAALDAQSLEDIVNGADNINGTGVVTTRLGQQINTVAKIISQANGRVNVLRYDTRALLFADLLHIAGTLAVVTNDSTPAYNTFYKKSGASGSGSWAAINLITPNMPAINGGDAGKLIAVKSDESGYELRNNLSLIGVNATPDATNKLSVASAESLFSYNGSGGHLMKVNKALLADSAAISFRNNNSTRALLGLLGDDNFSMRVSANGTDYNTSFIIANASGNIDIQKNCKIKTLGFASSTELTIATGSVTPTQTYHTLDTQSDASADDLDTVVTTNIPDGHLVILRIENASRVITLKHGTGNLQLLNGDIEMNLTTGAVILMRVGSNFIQVANSFSSAGFSSNGATPPVAFTSTTTLDIPLALSDYTGYDVTIYAETGGRISSLDYSTNGAASFGSLGLNTMVGTWSSVAGGAGNEPSYMIEIHQLKLAGTANIFGKVVGSSRAGGSAAFMYGIESYINAATMTHLRANFTSATSGFYVVKPRGARA
ncbi:hypothetical protein EKK58_10580 [Candidatus Dependentiae bacterium]|nr:MAG: hypothetical protein EKK58_10580 [Candidatus Dependentiae bacterium]